MERTSTETVELWVRAFEPATTGRKRERAIERLQGLETTPTVESVAVESWGRAVEETARLDGVPQLRTIRRRLESFDEWADRTDRRLTPFFRRERAESSITGRSAVVRRLPALALAEFDGEELVHVAPCREGERTIDVFDRLAALAEGSTGMVSFDGEGRDREPSSTPDRNRPTGDDRTRTDGFDRTRVGPPR